MNESIRRLEEKIAYLERHVTEQDKAMLELADDIARLRRELKLLRERTPASGAAEPDEAGRAANERPPHYGFGRALGHYGRTAMKTRATLNGQRWMVDGDRITTLLQVSASVEVWVLGIAQPV